MGSHDIDNDVTSKLGQIVRANHRIRKADEVRAGLIFEQGVHAGPGLQGPFHMRDESNPAKSFELAALADVAHHSARSFLVEDSIAQVSVRPHPEVELAGPLPSSGVDPDRLQAADVFFAAFRVDDMNDLLAGFEAFLDERKQHPITLVMSAEERADVTLGTKDRPPEPNLAIDANRIIAGLHPGLPIPDHRDAAHDRQWDLRPMTSAPRADPSRNDSRPDQPPGRGMAEGGVGLAQREALIDELPERPAVPVTGYEIERLPEMGRPVVVHAAHGEAPRHQGMSVDGHRWPG